MDVNLGDAIGLAIHPITGVAYVADGGFGGTNMLYSLNLASGMLNSIGPTGISEGISGLAFATVPEPSSFAMVFVLLSITSILRLSGGWLNA